MVRHLLLISLLFLCLPLFAQENITLQGKIIADSIAGYSVHIVNLNQERGTTNSGDGNFEILVRENDTLMFSSVQYQIKKVLITEKILKNKYLEVILTENVNELAEVQISNISLSGNLEQDLSQIKTFDQSNVGFPLKGRSAPLPASVEGKISSAAASPVALVINTLNGRLKMLRKAKKIMDFEKTIDRAIASCPAGFFEERANIPEKEIRNFTYFCSDEPEFSDLIVKQDELGTIELYLRKAPGFLKMLESERINSLKH